MKLAFYIAKRYFFSKKKHNAINIISGISVCGVSLATLALVCTLSVFNGFQDMVAHFFTAFDPDIKITSRQGKVFDARDSVLLPVYQHPSIVTYSKSLEDKAIVEYNGRQTIAVIKGVDEQFNKVNFIDSVLYGNQSFILEDPIVQYGIMGVELVSVLGTGVKFIDPLHIHAPKRLSRVNMVNPATSFNTEYLYSSGTVFEVNQQPYDGQYILTSLNFARNLFQYSHEISALELKVKDAKSVNRVVRELRSELGEDFIIQNRIEQQEDVFKIMEIEKLISYLFLTFILIIASFNIIGSLSMLMLDKKEDVKTLQNLGASPRLITTIFLMEGRLITLFGALSGVVIGLLLCFIQIKFEVLSFDTMGNSFVLNAYPVSVHFTDIVLILVTVIIIGFIAAWYPVQYFTKRLLRR
ncbi:MAG: FtsX-like permease family protein [Bacteroidales bacterium]|nr:FtsX-like permease family protein [Bacteroidales bacterium]